MSLGEAHTQRAAIRYAHTRGIVTLRLAMRPGVAAGYPDVLFILPNMRVFWIEFKSFGKSPTAIQRALHEKLRKQKHCVFVVDSVEGAHTVIDTMLRKYWSLCK